MRAPRALGPLALVAFVIAASGCSETGPDAGSTVIPTFSGPVNTVSINAGGRTVGDFRADEFGSHGTTYGTDVPIDLAQIPGDTPPSAVFNSERYGEMTYTIPERSGPQSVTLYFVESWVTGPKERLFDVEINGAMVLVDFDIYATAGGSNRAIAQTFGTTADVDGNVVIRFASRVQEPKVNGITVVGEGTTPPPVPAVADHAPVPPPPAGIGALASGGCGQAPSLHNGEIAVESGGTRSYILRLPETYDATHPYRLVLAYHWHGGTAHEVAAGIAATESPFYGLWDESRSSTIFVAPVGLGSSNDTGWANANGQDVAFTDAILEQVEEGLCIDTTRIFAVGFSYGAGMSYALACARPDVIRGVALFSGAELSGCDGGRKPIAFYASHGVADQTLGIARGRSLRDHFVEVNGVDRQEPEEPVVGSGTHICTVYEGGSPQYPVEWCAFDGGHNPNPYDDGGVASWSAPEVWAFISQF